MTQSTWSHDGVVVDHVWSTLLLSLKKVVGDRDGEEIGVNERLKR